jgi:pimeloyl-ACP methyl ester carboxylesterase
MGNSNSSDDDDFTSQGEAKVIHRALSVLGVKSYALLGNDSGGWIARELALLDPGRVTRLILTNTEIPDHRPPWIVLYQTLTRILTGRMLFRAFLKSRTWRRSSMGFGGCFQNLDLIQGDFGRTYLDPLISSQERLTLALRFLKWMDFARVDKFKELHRQLTMPVGLIWGAADPTFPEKLARPMAAQFPNVIGFKSIPRGKLFMHEEMPAAVVPPVLEYLTA